MPRLDTKQILDKVEELFNKKVEQKNSWGKNELKLVIKEVQVEILNIIINDLIEDTYNI